jgi:elongation factor P
MAPISTNDFKTGTTVVIDGNVYKVLEFLHVKPGKGSAFVRSKLRNLTNGGNLERTFKAGEMLEGAEVTKSVVQFNYMDGDNFVFMDMVSFETMEVPGATVGDDKIWMKEGVEVSIVQFDGKILDIEIPLTLNLEVAQTDPGEKGNTAQGATKPATLETGAEIQVPLFITTGELVRVETATKKYLGRAKE